MENKLFNQIYEGISGGSVSIPSVEMESDGADGSLLELQCGIENMVSVQGVELVYFVSGSQTCTISRGGYQEPDDYDCSDPEIEVEITGCYDESGDEVYMTGSQKERLEKLLNDKTEVK